MEKREQFERLFRECGNAVERYIRYRLPSQEDAADIFQEVLLTAYCRLETLGDESRFRYWILTIARNKCNDYFRARKDAALSLEYAETAASMGFQIESEQRGMVWDTLNGLPEQKRKLLLLCYIQGYPQKEIARLLRIPAGTVKSRLYAARREFLALYPCLPWFSGRKGVLDMEKKRFPARLPKIVVLEREEPPFAVICEEDFGHLVIPREGEQYAIASYFYPERTLYGIDETEVAGKAMVHGIPCMEIRQIGRAPDGAVKYTHTFYEKLNGEYIQMLAKLRQEGDTHKLYTFYDEDFLEVFGWGEDNTGMPTHLSAKEQIRRTKEGEYVCAAGKPMMDVVGRAAVKIGKKEFDTVCVMTVTEEKPKGNSCVVKRYIERGGRTVLWRRYNSNYWSAGPYQGPWDEKYPENDRFKLNGELFVHWIDEIGSFVL